jgi:hypothetical protein
LPFVIEQSKIIRFNAQHAIPIPRREIRVLVPIAMVGFPLYLHGLLQPFDLRLEPAKAMMFLPMEFRASAFKYQRWSTKQSLQIADSATARYKTRLRQNYFGHVD